jgi:hypothetical protein
MGIRRIKDLLTEIKAYMGREKFLVKEALYGSRYSRSKLLGAYPSAYAVCRRESIAN